MHEFRVRLLGLIVTSRMDLESIPIKRVLFGSVLYEYLEIEVY